MTTPLHSGHRLTGRLRLFLLLWLAATGWLPTQAWAQIPGPDGGTLSPATSTVCSGFNSGALTLSHFTGTMVKYQANNGGGGFDLSGGGGSPSYTFGNFTQTISFRAVVQNGATPAVTSSVATVTVNQPPTATINAAPTATLGAGGPTTFCQGGSVTLMAPTGTGFMYQFLNNNQPIASATAATYTANSTGNYSVAVTNASGYTSTSPATSVMVNPATTATFAYPAASFCVSSSLATTPSITGTAGGTFSAPAGLGLNTATGALTPSASTPGTYTVTYTVAGPCSSTGSQSVTITAPARAAFGYASAAYCATGTAAAVLVAGSTAGAFSSTTGLSVNPITGALNLATSAAGTYTVTNTVAASGGCVGTTAMATVTVNPQPATPTLSAAYNGAVTTLTSSAATSNQFYLNGAPIAGATGPTYVVNGTPAQLGSYTVVTTNATGCASAPSAPLVVTPTRASRLTIDALTAFPNPTLDGRLTVTMNDGHSEARLVLFNALGQQVLTATLAASATTHELDLSGMASGVYTLRATTTDGTATRRVVRQ